MEPARRRSHHKTAVVHDEVLPSRSGGLAAGRAVEAAERAIGAAIAAPCADLAPGIGALRHCLLAAAAEPRSPGSVPQTIAVAGHETERAAELKDGAHRETIQGSGDAGGIDGRRPRPASPVRETAPPMKGPARGICPGRPDVVVRSGGSFHVLPDHERLARLDEGLEAGQDVSPAVLDVAIGRGLGVEVVVDDGQAA
jgi:hypothetical protein